MIVKEEFLKSTDLKVIDIFIMNCIYKDEIKFLEEARKIDQLVDIRFNVLRRKGSIIYKDTIYSINDEYLKILFGKKAPQHSINVKELVDIYRSLFPKGSNNNGFPYKGDKQGCIRKMAKFVKHNPEYTEDTILKATQKYINEKRKDNYQYMHLAHYFIEKNGVSGLGAFCEQVSNGEGDSDFTNIINF